MQIQGCDTRELAQRMGSQTTIDEARYMANRLNELRYFDTEAVPEDVWLDLCREAADAMRLRYGL